MILSDDDIRDIIAHAANPTPQDVVDLIADRAEGIAARDGWKERAIEAERQQTNGNAKPGGGA